jgi:hypothetical protein
MTSQPTIMTMFAMNRATALWHFTQCAARRKQQEADRNNTGNETTTLPCSGDKNAIIQTNEATGVSPERKEADEHKGHAVDAGGKSGKDASRKRKRQKA